MAVIADAIESAIVERRVDDLSRLQRVAPRCKLVSLKVLGGPRNHQTTRGAKTANTRGLSWA
jgi:hypothetical protein